MTLVLSTPTIRRTLRPGDLDAIVEHHRSVYTREHGVNETFVADVAVTVAAAAERGFPGEREGIWIIELDGRHVGSIALTDEGRATGTVRWVLLDAELRGQGLGRRLVGELVEMAERAGYEKLTLKTFSDLRAAAHIYRSHGFEVVWAETAPRWGREDFTYQAYELRLPARGNHRRAGGNLAIGAKARPTAGSPA